jgi:tRNA-dihydrouridine synthase
MLEDVDDLEAFLEKIFDARRGYDISIKTRLGMYDLEEMYQVFEVYNKFPIKELSVHVRLQNEYYKHPAHMELFREINNLTDLTLSYNGDIYKASDVERLKESMGDSDYEIQSVMLGRGLIGNPFLVEDIYALEDGKYTEYDLYDSKQMERLKPFLDDIFRGYAEIQDANTAVYRMKEIWAFLIDKCTTDKKALKAIRKAKNRLEYEQALNMIF